MRSTVAASLSFRTSLPNFSSGLPGGDLGVLTRRRVVMHLRCHGLDAIPDLGGQPVVENVANGFLEALDIELFERRLTAPTPDTEIAVLEPHPVRDARSELVELVLARPQARSS